MLLCVSRRIESTAQIAGKLHRSISIILAYITNDMYSLSGDMQCICCCGLSIKCAFNTCNISYICSKVFFLRFRCKHLKTNYANSLKLVFSSSYAGCFCLVCWFSCSFVSEACACFGEWLREVVHVETFVRVLHSSRVNLTKCK